MGGTKYQKSLFIAVAVLTLFPLVSSALALLMGAALALTIGNPFATQTKSATQKLLPLAVIGLGAGMNLFVVARVGAQGVGYTVAGILTAALIGTLLGRVLNVERNTSVLITVGTAICGGSAIAAVAPVLRAKSHEVSVALGIVFLLNAFALFIFPPLGHALGMSEAQFGLWSALAIHDTSSVVGASIQYGPHALEIGTTVKLARALWIVPVTFAIGFLVARSEAAQEARQQTGAKARPRPKLPWFILGFLAMAALVTWLPALRDAGHLVELVAKRLLVLTLFLIGANLTRDTLRAVGPRAFGMGIILWLTMTSGTLLAILMGGLMP